MKRLMCCKLVGLESRMDLTRNPGSGSLSAYGSDEELRHSVAQQIDELELEESTRKRIESYICLINASPADQPDIQRLNGKME